MKKILITAGGTAIAWHICKIAKEYFPKDFEIQICDTNEPWLIPASTIATKTHKVPLATDCKYLSAINKIVENEAIDIIIPLIPEELFILAKDSEFIVQKNIVSLAPEISTSNTLSDKYNMHNFLNKLEIPTPKVYIHEKQVDRDKEYLIKPRLGFGSNGITVLTGERILSEPKKYFNQSEYIIQEYCKDEKYAEVTVEVFNTKKMLQIFSRQRISTKAGVCVKMAPVDNSLFYQNVKKLSDTISMPIAYNLQFLFHENQWKLYDCNLRLGAGTALSSAAGFQLTRAMLAYLAGKSVNEHLFRVDDNIKSVLRVYQEIVIK